jgi:hypothetical protein
MHDLPIKKDGWKVGWMNRREGKGEVHLFLECDGKERKEEGMRR